MAVALVPSTFLRLVKSSTPWLRAVMASGMGVSKQHGLLIATRCLPASGVWFLKLGGTQLAAPLHPLGSDQPSCKADDLTHTPLTRNGFCEEARAQLKSSHGSSSSVTASRVTVGREPPASQLLSAPTRSGSNDWPVSGPWETQGALTR